MEGQYNGECINISVLIRTTIIGKIRLFTNESMNEYTPVPVVNIPPMRFVGGPKKTGNNKQHTGNLVPIRIRSCDHRIGCTSKGGFG